MNELAKRVVIGIDAQTRVVAYARIDDSGIVAHSIERETSRGTPISNYAGLLKTLMRKAQDVGAVVYLEGVYLAGSRSEKAEERNVHTVKRLSEVQGEILYEARNHGVEVVVVTYSEWCQVLGRSCGREALKAIAQARAKRDTGRDDLTEHEADAVCIGQYGRMQEV